MPEGSTSGAHRRRIVRSAIFNLVGQALPALAALVAVRQIVSGLGVDRFGVLAIAWAAVGYAGLFDFGTGRALTRLLASRPGEPDEGVSSLIWTALAFMGASGVVMGAAVHAFAAELANVLAHASAGLVPEVASAVRVIAMMVPVTILTSGTRGILEAQHRFGLLNAITVPGTLATYLVPLLVLPLSPTLPAVLGGLLAVRVALLAAVFVAAIITTPPMRHPRLQGGHVMPLLTFGGWASVTNVVSPAIVQADRLLLGGLSSLASLGYYAVPAEVIARGAILPGSVSQVLFPAFAETYAGEPERAARLLASGVKAILGLLLPVVLVGMVVAPEALSLWLGAETARHSTTTARILLVAFFLNSLAFPQFVLIQAAGRPRTAALIHLCELPLHLAVAWLLIRHFGAAGAATATLLRNTVDSVAMSVAARRLLPGFRHPLRRVAGFAAGAGLVFALACVPASPAVRAIGAAVMGALAMAAFWRWLLEEDERRYCVGLLRSSGLRKRSAMVNE